MLYVGNCINAQYFLCSNYFQLQFMRVKSVHFSFLPLLAINIHVVQMKGC